MEEPKALEPPLMVELWLLVCSLAMVVEAELLWLL